MKMEFNRKVDIKGERGIIIVIKVGGVLEDVFLRIIIPIVNNMVAIREEDFRIIEGITLMVEEIGATTVDNEVYEAVEASNHQNNKNRKNFGYMNFDNDSGL